MTQITFIGGGNMANAIIGGLVAQGYQPEQMWACDPVADNLDRLRRDYGINTTANNHEGAAQADALVLAVKPQVMGAVCGPLRAHLKQGTTIISIAAGVGTAALGRWLGKERAIVRCMPNTPALVRAGASGLYANANVTAAQKKLAGEILEAVGSVEWLPEESLLDAVTAVSGSGPAYFFLLMEAMIEAGVQQGLARETATRLIQQTCVGAGRLAQCSDADVAELRRRVTSPNGTTEKALASFEADDFRHIVGRAVTAAAERAQALGRELEDTH